MALTKETIEDKIEVLGDFKQIQVRTATVVKEDDKQISRSFSRKVLKPGDIDPSDNYTKTDVSNESTEIKDITSAIWTQAVHDKWKAHLIANK